MKKALLITGVAILGGVGVFLYLYKLPKIEITGLEKVGKNVIFNYGNKSYTFNYGNSQVAMMVAPIRGFHLEVLFENGLVRFNYRKGDKLVANKFFDPAGSTLKLQGDFK